MRVKAETYIIQCDRCKNEILPGNPHACDKQNDFCWECGFVEGKLTEKEYLKHSGFALSNIRAWVEDGKINIKFGKYTPEELRIRRNKRARERYKQKKNTRGE